MCGVCEQWTDADKADMKGGSQKRKKKRRKKQRNERSGKRGNMKRWGGERERDK